MCFCRVNFFLKSNKKQKKVCLFQYLLTCFVCLCGFNGLADNNVNIGSSMTMNCGHCAC